MPETPVKEPPVEDEAPAKAPEKEAPGVEAPEKETKTEETPKKPEKKSSKKNAVIILLLLLLAIVIAVAVYFLFFRKEDDNRIPYAQGVVLVGDEEIEPVEEGWISLRYQKKAFSNDGVHFTGLLGNDSSNIYDMYFDVYADSDFEDQVYLSGLVSPGYGIQSFELSHALPAGSTVCYVVHNQVDTDEDGNQVIVNQMIIGVEFIVN